jgi:hypothetical protein
MKTDVSGERSSDFWLLTKRRGDVIKVWWETKFASAIATEAGPDMLGAMAADGSQMNENIGESGQQELEGLDPMAMDMEFLDDLWTRDFLSGDSDFTLETFW